MLAFQKMTSVSRTAVMRSRACNIVLNAPVRVNAELL
jgi:hypothetical protein